MRRVRLERQVAELVDDQEPRLGELHQPILEPALGTITAKYVLWFIKEPSPGAAIFIQLVGVVLKIVELILIYLTAAWVVDLLHR